MSQNKNVPSELPQDLQIALPDASNLTLPANTLGRQAVIEDEAHLNNQFEIDHLRTQHKFATELETKPDPLAGRIKYQLGRLARTPMSIEESQWLSRHTTADLESRIEAHHDLANEQQASKSELLQEVRDNLLSLTSTEKSRLDDYLALTISPFLLSIFNKKVGTPNNTSPDNGKDMSKDNTSWSTWLGKTVNDEQLTNFLQWHVHTLAEQYQSPEFKKVVERERAAYKTALQQGIDEGWLSSDASEAIKRVDEIKVYIGDMFDTLITDRGGYHNVGSDYVVIAQGIGANRGKQIANLIESLNHALMHEWNHAALGKFGDTWINEALTEHIAQVLKYGQPEIVSPWERKDKEGLGSYVARRYLLDTMLNYGAEQVSVTEVTTLYSTPGGDDEWQPSTFNDKLDRSWGDGDVVYLVSRHVLSLEKKRTEAGMDKMQAQEEAAHEAASDLLQQPEVIFGKGYKKPSAKQLAEV